MSASASPGTGSTTPFHPERSKPRLAAQWFAATLPLATLAALVYIASEWLFFVTKPSPTGALPLGTQLLVLVKAPAPLITRLLAVQVVASALSLVAYPRVRGVASVPGAVIGGFLLLMLIDNFTATIFGFALVKAGEGLRLLYSALLPVLVAFAGWKLNAQVAAVFERRAVTAVGVIVTALLAAVPNLPEGRKLPTQPDPSVLPLLTGGSGGPDRPNILFLGIDGVDADITSAYGYERQTTPFLESLRDDTLFFENAFSNVARTHGSLVTLLTGRLPFSTHVTFPPTLLQGPDGDKTLPMLLKSLGYTTLQLGMRHYADAEDTNVHGFDAANYRWQRLEEMPQDSGGKDETVVFRSAVAERIDERLRRLFGTDPVADGFAHVEGRVVVPQWRDERRVATLVEFMQRAPEPWFVHLHMLDTHCCFWKPDRAHFSGGPSASIDARDSQVRESDGNVRRLFAALKSSGRLERTIVVISSDHASEWKTTERVPLMIRFPDRRLRGRVSPNVQIADVAPTILDYLGADVPAWMDGESLLDADTFSETRQLFGVSDVQETTGPSGRRFLRDGGARNFGAAAVMMVAGTHVFELNLIEGTLTSRRVDGRTDGPRRSLSDDQARAAMIARITAAGFEVQRPAVFAAGVLSMPR